MNTLSWWSSHRPYFALNMIPNNFLSKPYLLLMRLYLFIKTYNKNNILYVG